MRTPRTTTYGRIDFREKTVVLVTTDSTLEREQLQKDDWHNLTKSGSSQFYRIAKRQGFTVAKPRSFAEFFGATPERA